ncbi:ADP-ribosylation factor-like protein 13B [Agrilus planipennis]|uniref:ADP-ribosylation factor-like protein 13B n=1 Tax=Agrilus planipennis TaxID=224129 RepID=A0A1W4WLE6_AGRPL|nr:ADP-ribosylation factor-like protein 13B [Agrilus planipennis]
MGNCCCNKNKNKRTIVLLLVGLDNAGKTAAARGLAGEALDSVMPTVGFSVINLKYRNYTVQIFDLGGGNNIRGIWERYFAYAHGVIFVVDSSDYIRLLEVRQVLSDLLLNKKISGKPVLFLANKQDQKDALDEIDLVEAVELEELVNKAQCPTLVKTCCATQTSNKAKLDPGIINGYHWLLNYIIRRYPSIHARVECDVNNQELLEKAERKQKLEKLKQEIEKKVEENMYVIEPYTEEVKEANGFKNGNDKVPVLTNSNEITVIKQSTEFDNSSSDSSGSVNFYHGTVFDALTRPKSAREMVKEQLQLETNERRPSLKRLFRPKTAPVQIYGEHPRTASKMRKENLNERTLRSAGDSIFVISKSSYTVSNSNYNNEDCLDLNDLACEQSRCIVKPRPTLIHVNGTTNAETCFTNDNTTR